MTALKAAVAIIVSAAGALVVALGPGGGTINSIDGTHWLVAILAVLGSGGVVYYSENGEWHRYIKAVVAFLSGGIGSLVIALNDGHITQGEYVTAFSAAVIAGAAVFQVMNTPRPAPQS